MTVSCRCSRLRKPSQWWAHLRITLASSKETTTAGPLARRLRSRDFASNFQHPTSHLLPEPIFFATRGPYPRVGLQLPTASLACWLSTSKAPIYRDHPL